MSTRRDYERLGAVQVADVHWCVVIGGTNEVLVSLCSDLLLRSVVDTRYGDISWRGFLIATAPVCLCSYT